MLGFSTKVSEKSEIIKLTLVFNVMNVERSKKYCNVTF